jgi:NACalpha-BTF3-like transcription factor
MKTVIINNKEVPLVELNDAQVTTKISNKKTGEKYKDEEALKAANIPEEDVRRDVRVIMPSS